MSHFEISWQTILSFRCEELFILLNHIYYQGWFDPVNNWVHMMKPMSGVWALLSFPWAQGQHLRREEKQFFIHFPICFWIPTIVLPVTSLLFKGQRISGRNNHLFHSCLVYSVWGCREGENATCHVQRRERYTVKCKKTKLKKLVKQQLMLYCTFDNEKTQFSIFGNVCLSYRV